MMSPIKPTPNPTTGAMNAQHGLTLIIITHDPDKAKYADSVLEMIDGHIVKDRQG